MVFERVVLKRRDAWVNLPSVREFARTLVLQAFDCLGVEALLTTTDEELRFMRPLAYDLGATIDAPMHGQATALVGDVVRHCVWRQEHGGPSYGGRDPGRHSSGGSDRSDLTSR